MARYSFYVDGFNLYHALVEGYAQFKWLNLRKMAESVVGPNDQVVDVIYFTAYAKWRPSDTVRRHRDYVRALRWAGVETVHGRFQKKWPKCHLCNRRFLTHEEKRTDVNIAVRTVRDAFQDKFDTAVIVSADSDLLPVIETLEVVAPEKNVGVMFPIGRSCYALRQQAAFRRKMPQSLLQSCQLPAEIPLDGDLVKKPAEWL